MESRDGNEKSVSAVPVEQPAGTIHAVEVYPVGVQAADPNIEGDAIRDDFIYLLCCAFTFGNTDFPKCWGARSECTLCCYENSSAVCKVVEDAKAFFICQSGGAECVNPKKLYSEYWQCCCFECYAALPPIEGKFKKIHNRHYGIATNFKPAGDATICTGGCCTINSCACNCDTCWGCYAKSVHCCLESECMQCKPLCNEMNKPNPDTWCICFKGHHSCVKPYTCVKSIAQCFCCDYRCALPCDEEVPCVYGLCCFCTLCVDWTILISCCSTINQVSDRSRAARGLPPLQHGAMTTTTTTTTRYTNVNAPPPVHATPAPAQYEAQQHQYKQAPSSAPSGTEVVSANEAYENKI